MIEVNELRKGVTFELDGGLWRVLEYSHHKPGRGSATIRTKVRNLRSGATVDRTFNSGERVQDVRLEQQKVQYLYKEGDLYHFMDLETYEQPVINATIIQDALPFLSEGLQVEITVYKDQTLGITLPLTVDLEVVDAEEAVKGDTATGATKVVRTSTGLQVQVPLFVRSGDVIRVDTRTGDYMTRSQ